MIGYCISLGDLIVSSTVSRPSLEAEYRALALTICEIQWLLYLLYNLNQPHLVAVPLFCDNLSAIHIAQNLVFHERIKYIDIDCHLVRENLLKGTILLLLVRNKHQLINCFTKALPPDYF